MQEHGGSVSRERRWAVLLVALLVIPLAVSAVHLWFAVGTSYRPPTDLAILELRARDVLHHAVYVGPYSRFGWNHPGPLLFYVLAVPYRILGSRSISMHVTALFVNGATIAALGWVAFRRGRLPMLVATLVPTALLVHALGADFLRDPWNPYLPVIPLFLLLLLCWSVAVGDLWMMPIAVGVASFTIQSHVGLALVSLVALLVATVGVVVHGVRIVRSDRREWWERTAKVVGVAAGVGLVLWAPVLWGTFVRHDGNLDELLTFFRDDHSTAGLTKGLQVMGLQWGPRPEWIFGARGFGPIGAQFVEGHWWLAVGLVLVAAATVVAVWRRSLDTLWLAGLLAVGSITSVIAVGNVTGVLFPYVTRWTWALGAALGILVLWGGWLVVPPSRRDAVLSVLVPVSGAVLAVFCVIASIDAIDAGTPYARDQAPERTITREVLAHLPPGNDPVAVDPTHASTVAPGIVLALERRGIPVRVITSTPVVYGSDRLARGGPYRATLVPVSGADQIDAFTPPGPRIAHYVRPWSGTDRRARERDLRQARALPPGKARDTLIKVLRASLDRPFQEISVYRSNPAG